MDFAKTYPKWLIGKFGRLLIVVVASEVKVSLLTLPFIIVTCKASICSTMSNGAPVDMTALDWFSVTCSSDIIKGIGSTVLPPNRSDVRAVNPLKIPSGREWSMFPYRLRLVIPVSPEKSPVLSEVIPSFRRSNAVIAARCVLVTAVASVTPCTAATIASRTSGERSLTARNVEEVVVSATFTTLTITEMVSDRLLSETVIDTT